MGIENGGQFGCPQGTKARQSQLTKGSNGKGGVKASRKQSHANGPFSEQLEQGRQGQASLAVSMAVVCDMLP